MRLLPTARSCLPPASPTQSPPSSGPCPRVAAPPGACWTSPSEYAPRSPVCGGLGGCTRCDIRLHPKPVSDISFFLAMFERSFFSHVLESARPHLCDPPTTIDCVAILMARWCCLFVLLVTKHNQRRCVGGGILILQNMHHKFHNSFSLDLYEVHVKIPVAGMGGFQWLAWVVCAHQGVW